MDEALKNALDGYDVKITDDAVLIRLSFQPSCNGRKDGEPLHNLGNYRKQLDDIFPQNGLKWGGNHGSNSQVTFQTALIRDADERAAGIEKLTQFFTDQGFGVLHGKQDRYESTNVDSCELISGLPNLNDTTPHLG